MKLVFFGDSICVGQLVSPNATWVTRLCQHTADRLNVKAFMASNVSISGNTTRMALERMSYDINSTGVDLMYYQFGLNDCNHWKTEGDLPRVMAGSYFENLIEIGTKAKKYGAQQLLLGTNHPVPSKAVWPQDAIPFSDCVKQYNELVRKVADRVGATLVDHEKHWLENNLDLSEYLLPDGIHLSERGHDAYYETTVEILTQAIDNLKSN